MCVINISQFVYIHPLNLLVRQNIMYFLLLLFYTAKPFSEVNTVMEMRYSPPNKPLPSPPPPSPPLRKTDLEPVYEIIA